MLINYDKVQKILHLQQDRQVSISGQFLFKIRQKTTNKLTFEMIKTVNGTDLWENIST